jgi:hypothetical protein
MNSRRGRPIQMGLVAHDGEHHQPKNHHHCAGAERQQSQLGRRMPPDCCARSGPRRRGPLADAHDRPHPMASRTPSARAIQWHERPEGFCHDGLATLPGEAIVHLFGVLARIPDIISLRHRQTAMERLPHKPPAGGRPNGSAGLTLREVLLQRITSYGEQLAGGHPQGPPARAESAPPPSPADDLALRP